MKKKIWMMILCGVLVLGSNLTALALSGGLGGKTDGGRFGDGPCWVEAGSGHREHMAEKLDLSEEQRQEAEKLFAANREQAEKLLARIKKVDRELRLAVNPKDFDEKALRKLAAEKNQLRTELMVGHARTRSRVYALLTPEQRELADLAHKLKQLRGLRREGHRGGFEGPAPRVEMPESAG